MGPGAPRGPGALPAALAAPCRPPPLDGGAWGRQRGLARHGGAPVAEGTELPPPGGPWASPGPPRSHLGSCRYIMPGNLLTASGEAQGLQQRPEITGSSWSWHSPRWGWGSPLSPVPLVPWLSPLSPGAGGQGSASPGALGTGKGGDRARLAPSPPAVPSRSPLHCPCPCPRAGPSCCGRRAPGGQVLGQEPSASEADNPRGIGCRKPIKNTPQGTQLAAPGAGTGN